MYFICSLHFLWSVFKADLHCWVTSRLEIGLSSVAAVNGDKSCQLFFLISVFLFSYLSLINALLLFFYSLVWLLIAFLPSTFFSAVIVFKTLVSAFFILCSILWSTFWNFYSLSPLVGFNSVEEKGNCRLCPSTSSSTQPTINCHPAYLSIFSGLTRAGHRVDPPPHKRELRQQCGPQTAAKFSLTAPILPKRPQKGSNLFCQT